MSVFPADHIRRQQWFDNSIYPFTSHYVDTGGGYLHYIDEGAGDPVVFVHGTPTWSFLYRNQVNAMSGGNRCIAVDHLGFGLSEKPADFPGTPQEHSRNLGALIDHLGLDNITLVVHDFGGPIGLGWAIENPDRVKRVVMYNTWLWETRSNPDATKADRLLNGWLGRMLYLNLNFSPRVLLKKGFADRSILTRNIYRHYTDIFPAPESRMGLLKIGQSLVGSSEWYQQGWERLDAIREKPVEILWGMKDAFLKPEFLDRWTRRLPDARVTRYDCGHFVPEEISESLTSARR